MIEHLSVDMPETRPESTKRLWYWIVLALYGVVLFVVLLYLRFPSEALHSWCVQRVEKILGGCTCTVANVQFKLPSSVILHDLAVKDKKTGASLYRDEALTLSLDLFHPFSHFAVEGKPFSGSMQGMIVRDPDSGKVVVKSLVFSHLDLSKLIAAKSGIDRKVRGLLAGKFTGEIDPTRSVITAVDGDIHLSQTGFTLKKEILMQDTVALDDLKAHLSWHGKEMNVEKGTFAGPLFSGNCSGAIHFEGSLFNCGLQLTGALEPQQKLYANNPQLQIIVTKMLGRKKDKKLPFDVGGTLQMPTFNFRQ